MFEQVEQGLLVSLVDRALARDQVQDGLLPLE
jgi:hypothetical protein